MEQRFDNNTDADVVLHGGLPFTHGSDWSDFHLLFPLTTGSNGDDFRSSVSCSGAERVELVG
jgi:hypothetical protein